MASASEIETPECDTFGAMPNPMTGGKDDWQQFCKNSINLRTAFTAQYGVRKAHFSTVNKILRQGLLRIEADSYIAAVEKKERNEKMLRTTTTRGVKVERHVVFMSEQDQKDRKEATVEERAAKVEIPVGVLEKIDAYYAARSAFKKALDDMHNLPEDTLFTKLQVFKDLNARAAKAKEQADETDANRKASLIEGARVEKESYERKLRRMKNDRMEIPAKIKKYEAEIANIGERLKAVDAHDLGVSMDLLVERRDKQEEIDTMRIEMGALDEKIKELESGIRECETIISHWAGGGRKRKAGS